MIVDTSVYLGHWPFRRHGYEESAKLARKLKSAGVVEAWASCFEGLLHKDLAGVNVRLAEECRRATEIKLVAFGSVNPKLPAWEDDLRRCDEEHKMSGIRLHPNYHGYKLDDVDFAALLIAATRRKMLVQIVVRMEDERTQHPLMQLPGVDLKPLPEIVAKIPDVRLQILNASLSPQAEALVPLARAGRVFFDFAMQESVGVVTRLVDRVGSDRVLLGSHFPLYHVESVILKIKEADLKEADVKAVQIGNARKLVMAK